MDLNVADMTTANPQAGKGPGKRSSKPVPALTIISHACLSRAGQTAFLLRQKPTTLSRNEPEFNFPDQTFGAPLNDPFVSRKPILFENLAGGVRIDNSQIGRNLLVDGVPCNGELVA